MGEVARENGEKTAREVAPGEGCYDPVIQAIVAGVARDLAVPVAFVSVVLDRTQIFRGAFGLPPELAVACGTGRPVSLCQFVVASKKPLVVNDARADSSIPQTLVEDFNIRAYAGVPVTIDGAVVGALCAVDHMPRQFQGAEIAGLVGLAVSVSRRLEAIEHLRRQRILTSTAGEPAFQEARNALFALGGLHYEARHAIESLRPVFNVLRAPSLDAPSKMRVMRSLEGSFGAFDDLEKLLLHAEASTFRLQEQVLALEQLLSEPERLVSIEVLVGAAERLLHHEARVRGGLRIHLSPGLLGRHTTRAPFLPAFVAAVRTLYEFRRPVSSSRGLGSSNPPSDEGGLVVNVVRENEAVVVQMECDQDSLEDLDILVDRLRESSKFVEGIAFERRQFDVCMMTPLVC